MVDSNTAYLQLSLHWLIPALVDACAGISRLGAQLTFDLEKAVVLRDALAAAGGACLDLPHSRSDRKIGDAGVVGLAGAMRDDGAIAVLPCHMDAFKRLGHGSNLIQLDKDGIGNTVGDALPKERGIRDKVVVSDELNLIPQLLGDLLPAGMIVLGDAVFDGPDFWILVQPALPQRDHLG